MIDEQITDPAYKDLQVYFASGVCKNGNVQTDRVPC